MTGDRDVELGEALRSLDVPPHGPDFFPQLLETLEADAASRRIHRLRPWDRPLLLAGAAAAVVVAVLVATIALPASKKGGGGPGPQLAAADVVARVERAVATATSLGGQVTVTCAIPSFTCTPPDGGSTTVRWTFLASADGSERLTSIGVSDDVAVDMKQHEERVVSHLETSPTRAERLTGLPSGPPDFTDHRLSLQRELGSVVRALRASSMNTPVRQATFDGRPAWRLVIPVQVNKLAGPGNSGDRLDVTVDRQTGFPLRSIESLNGRVLYELQLTGLTVNAPIPPGAFQLEFPAGSKPFVQDFGFRPVSLDQASSIIGYQPVLPKLPAGYKLTDVTAAKQGNATGTEGMNPQAKGVLSVAYTKGFDRIVVSTRRTGPDPSVWADPVATGEGFADTPEDFKIDHGALAGSTAHVVITPRGTPHVWAVTNDLVVTITGDVSATGLRSLVNSLG